MGPRPMRTRLLAWLAGAFFAVDLVAVAQRDRAGRRRPRDRARQHAGRARRPARVAAPGASGRRPRRSSRSRSCSSASCSSRARSSRAPTARTRARRRVRRPHRARLHGLPARVAPGRTRLRRACGAALRRDARVGGRLRDDRPCRRRPRLDAVASAQGWLMLAGAQLAGAGLAADHDLAAAAAGRRDVGLADAAAGLRRSLRARRSSTSRRQRWQLAGAAGILSGARHLVAGPRAAARRRSPSLAG